MNGQNCLQMLLVLLTYKRSMQTPNRMCEVPGSLKVWWASGDPFIVFTAPDDSPFPSILFLIQPRLPFSAPEPPASISGAESRNLRP